MTVTAERNKVIEEHLAAEAIHDAGAAASTYIDDGWYVNAVFGLRFEGRDMVALQYATSWQLIRDMKASYAWELDLGHTVVQVGRITGVVGSEVMGVSARGGPIDLPFTAVISLENGLMAGEHIWFDLGTFCEQVGVDEDAVRSAAEALGGTPAS